MSTENEYDLIFKALGHRMRRQLLDLLVDGPRTTGGLCEALAEVDRCTVMMHLGVLEKAGLIVVERRGRERWNHFDAMPIHDLQQRWIGPHAARAVTLLGRLREVTDGARDAGGEAEEKALPSGTAEE